MGTMPSSSTLNPSLILLHLFLRALLKQLEETQRENYEVTEYLRAELLLKTEKVADLEADMTKVRVGRMCRGRAG